MNTNTTNTAGTTREEQLEDALQKCLAWIEWMNGPQAGFSLQATSPEDMEAMLKPIIDEAKEALGDRVS